LMIYLKKKGMMHSTAISAWIEFAGVHDCTHSPKTGRNHASL
jgi:hypothetical protein